MADSIRALSRASPTVPIDGAIPASTSASVKVIAVYCPDPASEWNTKPCGGEPGVLAAAGEQRLLEGGHHQRRGLGHRDPPAEDPPGAHVGDEAHVGEPGQRPHVGEVGHPPHIGPGRRAPCPVDQVGVTDPVGSRRVVTVRCESRRTPSIPRIFISRATWSRPTSWPALRMAMANLSAP